MDPAIFIGVGLALGAIFGSLIMDGGNIGAMFLIPPMILVFGGTIGAAIAGGILPDAKGLITSLKRAFTTQAPDADDVSRTIVRLAEKARREGLLSLEPEVAEIEDDFLRGALEMVVDGTDADEVAEQLGIEIDTKRAADAAAAKIFKDMGGYAPTIGIIGTVLGLVHVLGSLSNPSSLGAKIASAFVATLWGVMTANVFWFPIANRLKRLSEAECEQREIVVEGVLAIQAGTNPRLIARRLSAMVTLGPAGEDDSDEQSDAA